METKNTIEYKIEQEHFNSVIEGMLKQDIVDTQKYWPHLEKFAIRDYNLITDFLGINTEELDIPDLSKKYNLCTERVKQITNKFARRYYQMWNRRFYLNGEDYPILFDWKKNIRG